MRLTAELVQQAEQRTNPLGDRELLLRGCGIPMLENLSVTRDMYDCIDLSDNRITTLSNFPRLLRCHTLLLGDNLIDHVDATNVSRNAPSLKALVLTNNKIQGLHEIENLGKACPNLDFLILTGNPVCRRQYYRLYVIWKLPKLKVLDYEKVREAERDQAQRLSKSAAGAALEGDVRVEARLAAQTTEKTFVPGEAQTAEEAFKISFTPEQKAQIREMVANASSPAEIERIESMVKRGIFPNAPPPPPGA